MAIQTQGAIEWHLNKVEVLPPGNDPLKVNMTAQSSTNIMLKPLHSAIRHYERVAVGVGQIGARWCETGLPSQPQCSLQHYYHSIN